MIHQTEIKRQLLSRLRNILRQGGEKHFGLNASTLTYACPAVWYNVDKNSGDSRKKQQQENKLCLALELKSL